MAISQEADPQKVIIGRYAMGGWLSQRRSPLRRLLLRVLRIVKSSRMLFCDYSLIHGGINYQMILVWARRDNRRDCSDASLYLCPLSLLSNRPFSPSFLPL